MAFIRSYMNAGDPFRFHFPKIGLKRSRYKGLGRAISRIAQIGSAFVPGLGVVSQFIPQADGTVAAVADDGTVSTVAPEDIQPIEQAPQYPPQLVEYARSFGIELGDPKPGPGRRGVPPRPGVGKQTQAMTRVSGRPARKGQRGVPMSHSTRGTTSARPNAAHGAGGGGGFLGSIGRGIAGAGGTIAHGGDFDLSGFLPGGRPKNFMQGLAGGGKRHRSMNPTNVRALRRSIRRVEGFEKIVKRIEKAFPRLRGHRHNAAPCTHRKRK